VHLPDTEQVAGGMVVVRDITPSDEESLESAEVRSVKPSA
jgi:hypothetical protein